MSVHNAKGVMVLVLLGLLVLQGDVLGHRLHLGRCRQFLVHGWLQNLCCGRSQRSFNKDAQISNYIQAVAKILRYVFSFLLETSEVEAGWVLRKFTPRFIIS